MAGDWIKMRKTLLADPRVVRISSALQADRFRTIGGLMSAWCLLDDQTENGKLEGYTDEIFDDLVGFPGISAAMAAVGWLVIGDGFLAAPRFDEHNGQTAKRRAQDAVRKASARKADKCPHAKRTKSGLEKIREEKSNNTPLPPEGEWGGVLPDRWRNIPKIDRRNHKCLKNSQMMERIGGWFNRRTGTIWTLAEGITLHAIEPHPDDVDLLESYYLAEIHGELDFRRRDLATLLNNWQGEVDRARIWKAENP